MGFFILLFFGVYLCFACGVILAAIWIAKQLHGTPALWGSLAFLTMVNLPLWDRIPVSLAHSQQCEAEAGLTIYKTLEQWQKENPNEVLYDNPEFSQARYFTKSIPSYWSSKSSDKVYVLPNGTELRADYDVINHYMYTHIKWRDGSGGNWINQRFYSVEEKVMNVWHILYREERKIVDFKTRQIIAREVDFYASPKEPGDDGIDLLNILRGVGHCDKKNLKMQRKWTVNGETFSSFKDKLRNLNQDNKR
jgi:hypothetical protein